MGDIENIVRAQKIHSPIPHLAGSRFPARKWYVGKTEKQKNKEVTLQWNFSNWADGKQNWDSC